MLLLNTVYNSLKSNKLLFTCIFLFLIYAVEVIRAAWLADDAIITLRHVMNFVHGFGPTYNIDERVQGFTHPLWFLIQSGLTLIFKNVFVVNYVLSICLSLLVFWIFINNVSKNMANAVTVALVMILSRAFVDYSASGLENPLSHLLLIFMSILT